MNSYTARHGTSVVNIARLQRIHYSAARLILRRPRSGSARPLLQELHWLPVARRVDFKILVLTYKAMHDEAPVYLCELERLYQPARALRSASSNSLEVKRTRTKAGRGSFAVAAASLWNTLPCYKNFTGCPWHAESISRYWYLHTKPFTTKRQCICVNSCAHINGEEHCALPAVTVWK